MAAKHKSAGRRPAAAAPDSQQGVAAHFAQGLNAHRQGEIEAAETAYRAVLALDPRHPDANNNLAIILRGRRAFDDALDCYRRALSRSQSPGLVCSNLGCLLLDMKRRSEAAACFRRAVAVAPDCAEAYFNLGHILRDDGDPAGMAAAYRAALRHKPDLAEAHNNLGLYLKDQGDLEGAVASFNAAIHARPSFGPAYANLGEALKEQGRIPEAVTVLQKGLAADPGCVAMHSNLLFAINYADALPAQTIFRAHVHWAQRHADPLTPVDKRHANDRNPDRRLRVGFVSPDFNTHSVSFFFAPLLRELDRRETEVFCYAEEAVVDITTERLRTLADHWRPIRDLDDDATAALIETDRIDILVDLAGHTANNRLLMLARKPAPVQASWLGYPNTTGMLAVDFRLTDAVAEPPAGPATPARETPVILPNGFHCYEPPFFAPPCDPPPFLRNGYVTFGSFNNLAKVTPETIRVWAALLNRVPNARLLLKGAGFAHPSTRQYFQALFARHGVAADRLDLLARIGSASDHLRAYGRIDIALDPFPYNGTTTTCEALWMGAPVIVLRGDRHVARVGASLLTQCGLPELIAGDETAYLDMAVALAGDSARLAALRDRLREQMRTSALCDAPGFARAMERALRLMWRTWLERTAMPVYG